MTERVAGIAAADIPTMGLGSGPDAYGRQQIYRDAIGPYRRFKLPGPGSSRSRLP